MLIRAGRMGVRFGSGVVDPVLADQLLGSPAFHTAGTHGPDSPTQVHSSLIPKLGVQLDYLGRVPGESQAVCGPQGDQSAVP